MCSFAKGRNLAESPEKPNAEWVCGEGYIESVFEKVYHGSYSWRKPLRKVNASDFRGQLPKFSNNIVSAR